MKKIISLMVALMPIIAFAQKFDLNADGWFNADDPSKNFLVVEVPGTKAELFAKAKTAVVSMWNSPKDVLSYNEPDIIIINGYNDGSVSWKKYGFTHTFGFPYRIQLQFKDGKVRIDAPGVDHGDSNNGKGTLYFGGGKSSTMAASMYIFDENGKLKMKEQKEQLVRAMNELVYCLVEKIKNGASQEDW